MATLSLPDSNATLAPPPARGWVLYDGECPVCLAAIRRIEPTIERRGFKAEPLQAPWVAPRLGLSRGALLREMVVLTPEGVTYGGADALLFLARHVGWAMPLVWLGAVPGGRNLLDWCYRKVAERRHCLGGQCRLAASRASHLRVHHGASAFFTMP